MRRATCLFLAVFSATAAATSAEAQDACDDRTGYPPAFFSMSDAATGQRLERSEPVVGKLTRKDRAPDEGSMAPPCDKPVYYDIYTADVRRGEWVAITLSTNDFSPNVAFYVPGKLGSGAMATSVWRLFGTYKPSGYDAERVMTMENIPAGPALIVITTAEAGQTGEYQMCWRYVENATSNPCWRPETSSSVGGLFISPLITGSFLASDEFEGYDRSEGFGARAGAGFGPITMFAEYSEELGDTRQGEGDGGGLYDLKTIMGGMRYHFLSEFGSVRPYLQGHYGVRERESELNNDMFKGQTFGGGIGLDLFFGQTFALDLGGFADRTKYGEMQVEGEDDFVELDSPTTWTRYRLNMGASWYLRNIVDGVVNP